MKSKELELIIKNDTDIFDILIDFIEEARGKGWKGGEIRDVIHTATSRDKQYLIDVFTEYCKTDIFTDKYGNFDADKYDDRSDFICDCEKCDCDNGDD